MLRTRIIFAAEYHLAMVQRLDRQYILGGDEEKMNGIEEQKLEVLLD